MATEGSATATRRWTRARTCISLFTALSAVTALICWSAATRALASPAMGVRVSQSSPLQGIYEYCAPATSGDACVSRLRKIAAGGFRVVLNYAVFDADRAQLERYMDAAGQLGIQLIWPMKDRPWWGSASPASAYPALAASCHCDGHDAFLRYVVGLVQSSPATWGYYVADEQSPHDAPQVIAFSRRLHALDPHHPRLAVAVGDDDVARLLRPYAQAADVLGADSYPIGTGQPATRVAEIAGAVRGVTDATHRATAMVLQGFNWSAYPDALRAPGARWPTRREMREMRDLAIQTAHPSLILWYSYFDITNSANASAHWRDLIWAAAGS